MATNKDILAETKKTMIVKYPLFAQQIANAKLSYSDEIKTACTDGKNIYFNSNFFDNLSDNGKLFVIAHELLHIRFEHMYRLLDKQGKLRDMETWNIATDAIINANLERDGFTIPQGAVNIKDALSYTAEQLYNKLLQEKNENQNNNGQNNQQQKKQQSENNSQQQNNQTSNDNQSQQDNQQNNQSQQNSQQNEQQNSQSSNDNQSQQNNQQQSENNSQQDNQSQSNNSQDVNNQNNQQKSNTGSNGSQGTFSDDHSMWKKAFEERQNEEKNGNNKHNKNQNQNDNQDENGSSQENIDNNQNNNNNKGKGGSGSSSQNDNQDGNSQDNQNDKNNKDKINGAENGKDSDVDGENEDNDGENNDDKNSKIQRQSSKDNNKQQGNISGASDIDEVSDFDEKKLFEENRKVRLEKAKEKLDKIKDIVRQSTITNNQPNNLGKSEPVADWKLILKRKFDNDEIIWSQHRSIAENNYAYRMTDFEDENESITEVMLDVSGSIPNSFIKSFLRQLKPILKESKLRVACFDTMVTEFAELKTDRDIDKYYIRRMTGGTDLDVPVRSFTKDPKVNKIVFTDGESYDMPKKDLKDVDVIWIVYDNDYFKPCCGKVINVKSSEFKQKSDLIINDNALTI